MKKGNGTFACLAGPIPFKDGARSSSHFPLLFSLDEVVLILIWRLLQGDIFQGIRSVATTGIAKAQQEDQHSTVSASRYLKRTLSGSFFNQKDHGRACYASSAQANRPRQWVSCQLSLCEFWCRNCCFDPGVVLSVCGGSGCVIHSINLIYQYYAMTTVLCLVVHTRLPPDD